MLCTIELRAYAALIEPPKPPTRKSNIAQSEQETSGLPHGRVAIQPNNPFPPRNRPATSSEAQIVNAVTKLGNEITIVLNVWNSFQPAEIPGSWN